jgi:hypothetical protein
MVSFWWMLSSWFVDGQLLPVSSNGRRENASSYKGTDPIMKDLSSGYHWNLIISEASPPNIITLGISLQNMIFEKVNQSIPAILSCETISGTDELWISKSTPPKKLLYCLLSNRYENLQNSCQPIWQTKAWYNFNTKNSYKFIRKRQIIFCCCFVLFLVCSSGWPQTCNTPASAFGVLG